MRPLLLSGQKHHWPSLIVLVITSVVPLPDAAFMICLQLRR